MRSSDNAVSESLSIDKLKYPDLPSIESKYVGLLRSKHANKLFELIDGVGSPLHCVFPQQFSENVLQLTAVLHKHDLQGKIYFAKKANKARCFVKACKQLEIGIDVASKQELAITLSEAISGSDISVSGPEKSIEFVSLSVACGAQIAVDSIEELKKVLHLFTGQEQASVAPNPMPRILLRFKPGSDKKSRFGMAHNQLVEALELLRPYRDKVKLLGFSFHLSGYSIYSRVEAAVDLVKWVGVARDLGFSQCNQINLGGGLPVKYTSTDDWMSFKRTLMAQHFHQNHVFVHDFYPYGNELNAVSALDKLLSSSVHPGISLSQLLRRNDIKLALEPGRALLDQAGVSVFGIQGVKLIDQQYRYWVATVTGTSFSLSEQWFGSEFLPSPWLLKSSSYSDHQVSANAELFPTAIAGASCLEYDMVSWRKIPFPIKPAVDDCLIYPNTAGYQMDSNESTFHSLPQIPKVAMWFDENKVRWQLDAM
jgi:diaminopimelate decarboxylase